MYISELIQYLLWPAFIIVAWFIIKASLLWYEKKFPAVGHPAETDGQKSSEISDTSK